MEEKGSKKPISIAKLWFLIAFAFVALLFFNYIKIFHSSTFGERWKDDATFWDLFMEPSTHLPVAITFGIVLLVGVVIAVLWNYWRKD